MRPVLRQALRLLPALVVMATIFVLSATPSADVDHGLAYLLLRKSGHFCEYALLAATWWFGLRPRLSPRAALAAAWLISVAYAASDEWHQTFVANRDGRAWDVLIDAGGVTAATLLLARLDRRRPLNRARGTRPPPGTEA